MPQAEAEKCHPAGLDFPDFSEPLKREFLQLLQYTKNGEFSDFSDTVKRGFSSGDCATIGDTFSEREKLNFLQRKKGVKSELKDPDKKGRNGSCCLCGNGAFCGRLFPWRCWRLSRGIGGRTGQKGSQYGNGWRRWRFLTVEAAGERPGGGGAKSLRGTRRKTTPPGLRARSRNCAFFGVFRSHNARPRAWFSPPELPPFPLFSVELFHLREWGYFARKRPYFERSRKI